MSADHHYSERAMGYFHYHAFEALSGADGLAASIARCNVDAATRPWLSGSCRAPVRWTDSEEYTPSTYPHASLVPFDDGESRPDVWTYRLLLTIDEIAPEADQSLLVKRTLDYAAALREWSDRVQSIGAVGSLRAPFQVPRWPETFPEGEFLRSTFQALIRAEVVDPDSFAH
jgi:hypothetical protein